MSLDGRISMGRSVSTALSGDKGRERVQELRHEHDAILVGANTVITDDPHLTDRSGRARRRPLVRVVLDNRLRTPVSANLAKTAREIPTIVFTNSADSEAMKALESRGVSVIRSDAGARDLLRVLAELRERELQSVLVEGGSEVAAAFVEAGLVDKVTFLYSPIMIGGQKAPFAIGGKGADSIASALRLTRVSVKQHGEDVEITGYPAIR
jgi:diaminohydroxyphosphoribosylaminopyrimidine deaminase/5-amino-6-(5-phosphoribosylamino)uracil reductase